MVQSGSNDRFLELRHQKGHSYCSAEFKSLGKFLSLLARCNSKATYQVINLS